MQISAYGQEFHIMIISSEVMLWPLELQCERLQELQAIKGETFKFNREPKPQIFLTLICSLHLHKPKSD